MLASRLGALVKERRMLRQLTQAELAVLAGVSRAVVVRLERPGAASVRVESAERVLRALGLRIRIGGGLAVPLRERVQPTVLLH
jgi:transcriptional regulator with XRE-family HTH domain